MKRSGSPPSPWGHAHGPSLSSARAVGLVAGARATRSRLEAATICLALCATPAWAIPAQRGPSELPEREDSTGARRTPTPAWVVEGGYTVDGMALLSGGVGSGATAMHNLDLTAAVDLSRLLGGRGLSAFVYLLANAGDGITARSGDLQGMSNIEAPRALRLFEAWVEQRMGSGRGSVLVGLYDLNSEFYVAESAQIFLNSSHGIGPEFGFTGEGGPSIFPSTSLALRLHLAVSKGVAWRAAVLDAVPGPPGRPEGMGVSLSAREGALLITELEMVGRPVGALGEARLVLGSWTYTGDFEGLGAPGRRPSRLGGNRGFYGILEADAWACGASEPCVTGFVRLGSARQDINTLSGAWGAGVRIAGGGGREMGIALASAHAGRPYVRIQEAAGIPCGSREVNVEAVAHVPVTDWLTLTPDVQYVFEPGLRSGQPDVLLAGIRVQVAF